jgi:hypothetical protein
VSFGTALQTAIFQRLSTYAPIAAVVKGVYDNVPQPHDAGKDADYPYVVIGEDTVNEWDTDTDTGAEVVVTIHTWSRKRGRLETKTIQGFLYNALHRFDLSVTGYHNVGIDWESDQSFLDADGKTRHGVSMFRIMLD